MSTLSKRTTVKDVVRAFPELRFELGSALMWNPSNSSITYPAVDTIDVVYGLVHEIAHAKLGHDSFIHDIKLLKMERDAWNQAREIAGSEFGLKIDTDYIEDCLDSYRDWLYKRSLCPQCHLSGFQVNNHEYSCPHCQIDWKVPVSRLCVVKRKILA